MNDLRESMKRIFSTRPKPIAVQEVKSREEATRFAPDCSVTKNPAYFVEGWLGGGKLLFVLKEGVLQAAVVVWPDNSFVAADAQDKPLHLEALSKIVDLSLINLTEAASDTNKHILEDDVKNWISSKINAALLALGVDKEKWSSVEDVVFSAALAGKLGDGTPSQATAAAIADMVTELSGTTAAPTPEPEVAAGPETMPVGPEVGLEGETDVAVPEEPEPGEDLSGVEAEIDKMAAEEEPEEEGEPGPEEEPSEEEPEAPEGEEEPGLKGVEAEIDKEAGEEGNEFAKVHKGRAELKHMKPEDFDEEALKKGTQHELEHTDDSKVAQQIAMDHLAEDPKYYEKLEKMEKGKKAKTESAHELVATIEFPDMALDASALEKFGRDNAPRTAFDVTQEEGGYEAYYGEADEVFHGPTVRALAQQIKSFLQGDPVVKSAGRFVITMKEGKTEGLFKKTPWSARIDEPNNRVLMFDLQYQGDNEAEAQKEAEALAAMHPEGKLTAVTRGKPAYFPYEPRSDDYPSVAAAVTASKEIDTLVDQLLEQPVEAPAKPAAPPKEKPASTPVKSPSKPSTPIRPQPGQNPHPKASLKDIELFKKVRTERKHTHA